MRLAASFFFALLLASAIPAQAVDKESSPLQLTVPPQTQGALTRGPYARQFLARAGLLLKQEETRVDLGHPLVPVVPGSTLVVPGDVAPTVLFDLRARELEEMAGFARDSVRPTVDGLCYTMRMYKMKPTERLARGESASRGYSTCELAENYQVRSAVAHGETAEAPKPQSQQK